MANAAQVTCRPRRSVTENPEVRTQRLVSLGEWAPVLEQNKLPAPSTWDVGGVGREPGKGMGKWMGQQ